MDEEREQRIRQRAYEIWEREGFPGGKEAEHWERAAAEIEAEDAAAGTDIGGAKAASDLKK